MVQGSNEVFQHYFKNAQNQPVRHLTFTALQNPKDHLMYFIVGYLYRNLLNYYLDCIDPHS